MKAILEEQENLQLEFARNIRDNNTRLAFTVEEVKGLPADYLAHARKNEKGEYLLGFGYPEYVPFMEYLDNDAARRRYQFAFTNRGTPRNLELLARTVKLRQEITDLFGYPSYAHFAVRKCMAETHEAIEKFLGEVQAAASGLQTKELEELRVYAVQGLAGEQAKAFRLQLWNFSYWQRHLKQERYQLDQNALRKYFPTNASVAWVLDVSGRLYGVGFRPSAAPVWHEDVRALDVIDQASGAVLGGIYLDLYPRDGKYGHAAAFGVAHPSALEKRLLVSALAANLNKEGLDGEELVTLLHEFGHVLHGVLSKTRYAAEGGTSVEHDFVEAPSQMYEEWARRLEPLRLLAGHCSPACPQVDAALVARMTAAQNFSRGIHYSRQLLYAGFDMRLHARHAPGEKIDPKARWDAMEGATPLGHVGGTQFPGSFGHLMGGYATGYYGYMWSEMLALDMLSRFGDKLLNPEVGRLYREAMLSRGGERKATDMVRDFLGRAPSSKAFYDEIAGKRLQ
ncbi:MAG: M3 family metallopeptidase [Candidatus Protistobacter heckmanni]|nr:M3 family metallopeptidase [Candidatus Protistobacter heckmanni]